MNSKLHFYSTMSFSLVTLSAISLGAGTIDFEDLPPADPNTAIAEEFMSGGAEFPGERVLDCCWSGWIHSNSRLNQDLAISPGVIEENDPMQTAHWSTAYVPPDGSLSRYAVASVFDSEVQAGNGRTLGQASIHLPPGETVVGLDVANTTWAAHSMLVGDGFSGPFADNDFFRLTILGFNGEQQIGQVDVSLAEGRNVLDDWLSVSLTELSGANRLEFALASSDVATFGDVTFLNTPAYFAVDNLTTAPGNMMIRGDFDGSGQVDSRDVDLLSSAIRGNGDRNFDLDGSGVVDGGDLTVLISSVLETWLGDSNLDGDFNSGDLVNVFQVGEYNDNLVGNSSWATGDWNADGEFDSSDIVVAFQDGGFDQGRRTTVELVPEPGASVMTLIALAGLTWIANRDSIGRPHQEFRDADVR